VIPPCPSSAARECENARDNAGRRLRLVQRAAITVRYIKSPRLLSRPLSSHGDDGGVPRSVYAGSGAASPPLPRALFLVAHSTTVNSAVRVNENVTLRGMGAARSREGKPRENLVRLRASYIAR